MLITESYVEIVDNSGAKWGKCVKVLNQSSKAKAGDLILVSLRKVQPRVIHKGEKKEQIKKGDVRIALVLQTNDFICRKDGTELKTFNNYAILITIKNKVYKILGTRYRKPLPKEIKSEEWMKILNISPLIF